MRAALQSYAECVGRMYPSQEESNDSTPVLVVDRAGHVHQHLVATPVRERVVIAKRLRPKPMFPPAMHHRIRLLRCDGESALNPLAAAEPCLHRRVCRVWVDRGCH